MPTADNTTVHAVTASELNAIFVSLELSRTTWLITALAAPLGSKMSRHQIKGGDMTGLLERISNIQHDVRRRTGQAVPVIVPGGRAQRVLDPPFPVAAEIESHVVDPASIAV